MECIANMQFVFIKLNLSDDFFPRKEIKRHFKIQFINDKPFHINIA